MTPEETKAAAAVMLAAEYCGGKCTNVEFRLRTCSRFLPINTPIWDWDEFEYRIKPKPEYRYCNIYKSHIGWGFHSGVDLAKDAVGGESPLLINRLRFEIIDGKLANPTLIGLEADE